MSLTFDMAIHKSNLKDIAEAMNECGESIGCRLAMQQAFELEIIDLTDAIKQYRDKGCAGSSTNHVPGNS
jgi:hypothetical protein